MDNQTAVNWLYKKLSTCTSDELVGNVNKWFAEAKEKETEQMVYFFERGCFYPKPIINTQIEGQKLYNQIYGDGK